MGDQENQQSKRRTNHSSLTTGTWYYWPPQPTVGLQVITVPRDCRLFEPSCQLAITQWGLIKAELLRSFHGNIHGRGHSPPSQHACVKRFWGQWDWSCLWGWAEQWGWPWTLKTSDYFVAIDMKKNRKIEVWEQLTCIFFPKDSYRNPEM